MNFYLNLLQLLTVLIYSWVLIKSESCVYVIHITLQLDLESVEMMWWDECAPRKVNVKLDIVGRSKKELIHKLDLIFETDEVHRFLN